MRIFVKLPSMKDCTDSSSEIHMHIHFHGLYKSAMLQ